MTPSLARRAFGLSLTAIIAYTYGRVEASWGLVPVVVFTLTAAVAWTAGFSWAAQQYADTTARANRERDQAMAEVVSIREGRRYEPVPLEQARLRRAMERHPAGGAS